MLAFFILHSSLFTLTNCAKFSAECELIVKPRLKTSSSSADGVPAYDVRIYAFYNVGENQTEVERWRPASYADAEAGVIRRVDDPGNERLYNLMAGQGEDTYAHLVLSSSPVMLVAVDPVHRIYGWRFFQYMVPMPKMDIVVYFRPWAITETQPYDDYYKPWRMRSEKFDVTE